MGLVRHLLLRGSRSRVLREALPRYRFMRRAVARFVPGENIDDALNAAEVLRAQGIATVVTHLGENLEREDEATTVANHYRGVLENIRHRNLDCHISVKLTQLGLDFNQDLCIEHLSTIVQYAAKLDNFVWIDMESNAYVDRTLEIYRKIRAGYSNVGVCVQSYLYRTARDLESLNPLSPSIRLVKGTYAEPKDIAYRSKREVDENFFSLTLRLLELGVNKGIIIGIATHDMSLLARISRHVAQRGFSKQIYEIQMLYGIKREQQQRLAKEGYRIRVLISYGSFWFPWYMRRLAERPANVLFIVKNVFAK